MESYPCLVLLSIVGQLSLNYFNVVHGKGLSLSGCKSKWEECMDEPRVRPSSADCDDFIRRNYECPEIGPLNRMVNERSRFSEDDDPISKGFSRRIDNKPQRDREDEPPPRSRVREDEPPPRSRVREDEPPPRSRVREDEPRPRAPPPRYQDAYNPRPRPRPRVEDNNDEPSIEVDQKTRTVKDAYNSKYQKDYSDRDRPSPNIYRSSRPVAEPEEEAPEIRRRDRTKKERERIVVKEDLIEVDDNDGGNINNKQTVRIQRVRPAAGDQVRVMQDGNANANANTEKSMADNLAKFLDIKKALL